MSDATYDPAESVRKEGTLDPICVVGMGYVGLPLAVAFDRAGATVAGYDVDARKIDRLASGVDPTGEIGDETIDAGAVEFTADPGRVREASYVITTVPTPIDEARTPSMAYVEAAGRTIGEYLSPGTTVVLESTVYPGATRSSFVPAIEETSGMTQGEEFHVGYSPERLAPGTDRQVTDVVKIVAGESTAVCEDLVTLYERIVKAGVYPAPDIETAEAAKVLENVQRDVNIALVNELAMACAHLGLDTEAVLEAAETKWNFHDSYRPGLVGGHCIPVDPYFLAYRLEREGFSPKLIRKAREINEHMPRYVGQRALRALNRCGKVLEESRVLVLGLAYKPNVGDVRTSQVSTLLDELSAFDVDVVGYDPHADDEEVREQLGVELLSEYRLDGFDGVVVATGHDEFRSIDLDRLAEVLAERPMLLDVPRVYDPAEARRAGFEYVTV